MKLVDANVLLYAVNSDAPHFNRMRTWWEAAITNGEPIGLTWMVLIAFVRLSTHPKVFIRPLTPAEAMDRLNTWFAQPNIRIVTESEEHWAILKLLIEETGTAGNLTNDAHLAATAISYGASVVSCDFDFGRFNHLRWENPLV